MKKILLFISLILLWIIWINNTYANWTCDANFTWKLRLGQKYYFNDYYNNTTWYENYIGENTKMIFSEPANNWDYNWWSNPKIYETQWLKDKEYYLNPWDKWYILTTKVPYEIKYTPLTRSLNNLLIKYDVEYYVKSNWSRSNAKHHTECKRYEITWCWDGIIDKYTDPTWIAINEQCDPNDPDKINWWSGGCSTSCKKTEIPERNVCTQTFQTWKLRLGTTYKFSDEFTNNTGKKLEFNEYYMDFDEDPISWNFNEGPNPVIKFTQSFKNKNYTLNNWETHVIAFATPDYPIVSHPASRKNNKLDIRYIAKYYEIDDNWKAEWPFFHTECKDYEVTWCWDWIRDNYTETDWTKIAEQCDPNDPNKVGWDVANWWTCSNSCEVVYQNPVCNNLTYSATKNPIYVGTDNLTKTVSCKTTNASDVKIDCWNGITSDDKASTKLYWNPNWEKTVSFSCTYNNAWTYTPKCTAKKWWKSDTNNSCQKELKVFNTSPGISIDKTDANVNDKDWHFNIAPFDDTQTILKWDKAVFWITVENAWKESLTDVEITDPKDPNCKKSKTEVINILKTIWNKDSFLDVWEKFYYTCESSIKTINGDNTAYVTWKWKNSWITDWVNDNDITYYKVITLTPSCSNLSYTQDQKDVVSTVKFTCNWNYSDDYKIEIKNSSWNVIETIFNNTWVYTYAFSQEWNYTATCYVDNDITSQSCIKEIDVLPELKPSIWIEKMDSNLEDLDNNVYDSQTVLLWKKAEFLIKVTNTWDEDLTNVLVTDPKSPSCDRTESQTKALYSWNVFKKWDSFSYKCIKNNTTKGYKNIAYVIWKWVTSWILTDKVNDDTDVKVVSPSCDSLYSSKSTWTIDFTSNFECSWSYTNDYKILIKDSNNSIVKTINWKKWSYKFTKEWSYKAVCYVNNNITSQTCERNIVAKPVISPSIKIDKTDINHDLDRDNNVDDEQTLYKWWKAIFKIRVTNDWDEPLKNIVLTDAKSSNCAGNVTLPNVKPDTFKNFKTDWEWNHNDNYLQPWEWFEYTCEWNSESENYTNIVKVEADWKESNITKESTDDTKVYYVEPICTNLDVDKKNWEVEFISNFQCSWDNVNEYKILVKNSSWDILETINSNVWQYNFKDIDSYSVECYVNKTISSDSCKETVIWTKKTPWIWIDKTDSNQNWDIDWTEWNDTQTVIKWEKAEFRIIVTNTWWLDLNNIVLSDELASNCSGNVVPNNTKTEYPDTFKNFTIHWSWDHTDDIFQPWEVFEFTCKKDNTTEDYTNSATVKANSIKYNEEVEDTDTTEVIVWFYDLALDKKVINKKNIYRKWDKVEFEIKVTNQWDIEADDIIVTDYIPDWLILKDVSWVQEWNKATREIWTLLSKKSEIIKITFEISADSGKIINWAEISSTKDNYTDCDSTYDNNQENDIFKVDNLIWSSCNDTAWDEDDHDPAEINVTEYAPKIKIEKFSWNNWANSTDLDWIIEWGEWTGSGSNDTQTLTYWVEAIFKIVVTNIWDEDLKDVKVEDILAGSWYVDCNKDIWELLVWNNYEYTCKWPDTEENYINLAKVTGKWKISYKDVLDENNTEVLLNWAKVKIEKFSANNWTGSTDLDWITEWREWENESQLLRNPHKAKFRIVVTNIGNKDLEDVKVIDTLDWTEFSACNKDIWELTVASGSIEYTCEWPETDKSYTNTGSVTAKAKDSSIILTDENSTQVILKTSWWWSVDWRIKIEKYSAQWTWDQDWNQDMDPNDDSQLINKWDTAKFNIKVSNDGTKNLIDISITDAKAPNCSKTIEETKAILKTIWNNDEILNPDETFTYTCELANAQSNYINTASVVAKKENWVSVPVDSNDSDTTEVKVKSGWSGGSSLKCDKLTLWTETDFFDEVTWNFISKEVSMTCNGYKDHSQAVDCWNWTMHVDKDNNSKTSEFTCVYNQPWNYKVICGVSRAKDGWTDISKYKTSFSCKDEIKFWNKPWFCWDWILQPEGVDWVMCNPDLYPNDPYYCRGNSDDEECDWWLFCNSECKYVLTKPVIDPKAEDCSDIDYYDAHEDECSNVTYPSGWEIQFWEKYSVLIWDWKEAFEWRTIYVANIWDERIDLPYSICVYNTNTVDRIFKWQKESACKSSPIWSIFPGEEQFFQIDQMPEDERFISDINLFSDDHKTNELHITLSGFPDHFAHEKVYVTVAKPWISVKGWALSFIWNNETQNQIANVNDIANEIGSINTEQTNIEWTLIWIWDNDLSNNWNIWWDIYYEASTEWNEYWDSSSWAITTDWTNTFSTTSFDTSYNELFNWISNVIHYKNTNVVIDSDVNLSLSEPRTYIIENGDLIISWNIEADKNIAFIVKWWNIIFNETADYLSTGNKHSIKWTYISIDWMIKSPNTEQQLKVNGSLYGNLNILRQNRTHIKLEDNWTISVGTVINFGSNILNKPAPLVSKFIWEYIESTKVSD